MLGLNKCKHMKIKILLVLLSIGIFSSCKSQDMKVMTYNIRLDIASDGENAWPNRKDFLSSQVMFLSPDIMGVQEARPNQISDLQKALPNFSYIGNGRDGGADGEHTAIFFNTSKVKVENDSTFWLSQTPEILSKGWDAAYPRICTYGKFSFVDGNQKVWVFNTHLDHQGAMAQKEGLKLVLEKIEEVNVQNLPVILMGDFNVEPKSEVLEQTKLNYHDAKTIAETNFGPVGTFNGFNYNNPVTRRIDYLLVSKLGKFEIEKYAVLSSAVDFKFPSDHFPVFISFNIK